MRERPILMSAPMVRALRDGRKTMTRRVVKPQPTLFDEGHCLDWHNGVKAKPKGRTGGFGINGGVQSALRWMSDRCPYGVPGDRLWVRETWHPAFARDASDNGVIYRADYGHRLDLPAEYEPSGGWRPSIHMPRWASRLTLTITDVRVERVRDITEADARAEGAPLRGDYRIGYAHLWNSLNAARGYGWDANPFVWALTFTVDAGARP